MDVSTAADDTDDHDASDWPGGNAARVSRPLNAVRVHSNRGLLFHFPDRVAARRNIEELPNADHA
jgi:hypothetical protein